MNRRRALIGFLVATFLGLGFFLLAWRPSIAPIPPPSLSSFSAELVSKGETLSAIGHCAACHTQPGGQPFAGGYRINTPFGAIFGTNITPDPRTGIGSWSLEAFSRAMREGVARDGSHLLPAFPYYAFTKLSDDDVKALYAYLMTRQAVYNIVPLIRYPSRSRSGHSRKDGRYCHSEVGDTSPTSRRAPSGIAEPISPKGLRIVRVVIRPAIRLEPRSIDMPTQER